MRDGRDAAVEFLAGEELATEQRSPFSVLGALWGAAMEAIPPEDREGLEQARLVQAQLLAGGFWANYSRCEAVLAMAVEVVQYFPAGAAVTLARVVHEALASRCDNIRMGEELFVESQLAEAAATRDQFPEDRDP